jgi:hypothetical protein
VLAAAAVLLSACSSSPATVGGLGGGSGGGSAPTTVAQALAQVPATAGDSSYVEFGEVAKVAGLDGGASAGGPLHAYEGYGESGLVDEMSQPSAVLGFDPFKVTAALTVGSQPQQATILYGAFDPASIGAVLGKEGFAKHGTADGGTVWTYADNDQMSEHNPTGVPNLNVVLVSANRIVIGGSSAHVEAVAASSGGSLDSSAGLGAVAACLGPALAGVIGPQSATGAGNAPLLGIGLLGSSAQDASEELCVTVSSAAAASAVSAKWTSLIGSGTSKRLDEPWSALLVDPQASTLSPVDGVTMVRLTAKPASGQHVGVLLEDYYSATDDIASLINAS